MSRASSSTSAPARRREPAPGAPARRRPAGTGLIVEVLRTAEEFRALVPDWEALAADAAETNPFYEHWLLLPALAAYGQEEGFRLIAVWDSGTLAGLFPMRLERRYRGLPLRALRSWRHRNMLLCTPLVRGKSGSRSGVDAARACVGALLSSGLAPVMEFEYIAAGGPFYAALAEAATEARHPWLVTDAYARALLLRDRDPRALFTSNMKNKLRRSEARLAAHGKLASVRLEPDGDVAAWTEEFIRLEKSGWKGAAGSALGCRADDLGFATEVYAEAFRRGKLIITGLDLDGKPLARHCMLAGREGAFTFKIAFDETHAKASPGVLAEVDNVRQFMEIAGARGLRWIDSFTAPENTTIGRVWKDRRTIQRVAVGVSGAGRLAVAALPLMRLAKHALGGGRRRKAGGDKNEGAAGSRAPGASLPSGDRTAGYTVFGPKGSMTPDG